MRGPCEVLSSRSYDRVLHRAFVMLERRAVKVACAVLRGRGGGDTALLPGGAGKPVSLNWTCHRCIICPIQILLRITPRCPMKSLLDGLPPEVAQRIHPDWQRNETEY